MQKSQINPQILNEMLESAPNAADRGQSQFFTPLDFGRAVCQGLPKFRETILDLNCGAVHLLTAAANGTTTGLLGSDIDPCRSLDGTSISRITQDLTKLYPLLHEIEFKADLFVLNPPWGLEWHRDRLTALADSPLDAVRSAFKSNAATIDSTIATLMIALDLCSDHGEGVLIANNATLERLIFAAGAPHAALARHVWAHIIFPGNPMTGIDHANWQKDELFHTGILYFARGHTTGPKVWDAEMTREIKAGADPSLILKFVSQAPDRCWRKGPQIFEHLRTIGTVELWAATRERIRALADPKPRWNLWLSGGMIHTHLSRFEQRSVKVNKGEADRLFKLQGRSPMQLVLQRNEREELVHVAKEAGWLVQPELLTAIDEAIRQYHAARAPLYPLSKIMRLGYLDEHNEILCEKDLAIGSEQLRGWGIPFKQGQRYAIRTQTVATERKATKPNSMTGNLEDITYSGNELAIYLSVDDDTEFVFLDARLQNKDTKVAISKQGGGKEFDFTLQQLCEHFFIPEVPDVATANPAGYAKNIALLEDFERVTGSKLKLFQKEDLARAALHEGLIMGWDTGLGKTWTLFIFPLLKVGWQNATGKILPNAPVLIVAPGDLHQQIRDEAASRFKADVIALDSQDTFNRLVRQPDSPLPKLTAEGRPVVPPGFYITSYTQLTTNNVNSLPDPEKWEPRALMDWLCLKVGDESLVETKHELRYQPAAKKAMPVMTGWPDTAAEFFALRSASLLWRDEYDLFKLDCRYDVRKDLDKAFDRAMKAVDDSFADEKFKGNQRRALTAANDLLQNLVPARVRSSRGICWLDLTPAQQDFVIKHFCRRILEDYAFRLGEHQDYRIGPVPDGYDVTRPETDTRLKWRIKCVYSPSLSDLCYNAFDAVSIDEGVKMKGEDTLVGQGVRFLDPLYRCVATATPIKNRLPDIFRLAWWACGGRVEAHARFPYRDDSAERAAFAKTFLVQSLIEGETAEGNAYIRQKVTAEVCNVHRLWKLLGPIVLRRRKADCHEDIVPRIKKIFRCNMGSEQRDVYEYHLKTKYVDRNGDPAIGAQLQALRQAAVAPATPLLLQQHGRPTKDCPACKKKNPKCPKCNGTGSIPLPFRATSNYIPKTATVLTLIQEILARGEQVIAFSAFNEPNDELSRLLSEAGVRHLVLDGHTNQKKRGVAAAVFKAGRHVYTDAKGIPHQPIPVLLAGIECMAEGHSFHRCNNAILFAYSWAYDKFKQALDRIHRLNSEQPINVYVVFCDGTIDQRLESLTDEKGDAADLVLDGALMGERAEEVNFADLLRVAQREFAGDGKDKTICEARLASEWPALRQRLTTAQVGWDEPLLRIADVCNAGTPKTFGAASEPELEILLPVAQPKPSIAPLPNAWRERLLQRAALLQFAAA